MQKSRYQLASILCCLLLGATSVQAEDKRSDWQDDYAKMDDSEKQAFQEQRNALKTMMNKMTSEEREAFRAKLNSGPAVRGRVVYIEAIPPEVREEFEKISEELEKQKSNTLSLHEKMELLGE